MNKTYIQQIIDQHRKELMLFPDILELFGILDGDHIDHHKLVLIDSNCKAFKYYPEESKMRFFKACSIIRNCVLEELVGKIVVEDDSDEEKESLLDIRDFSGDVSFVPMRGGHLEVRDEFFEKKNDLKKEMKTAMGFNSEEKVREILNKGYDFTKDDLRSCIVDKRTNVLDLVLSYIEPTQEYCGLAISGMNLQIIKIICSCYYEVKSRKSLNYVEMKINPINHDDDFGFILSNCHDKSFFSRSAISLRVTRKECLEIVNVKNMMLEEKINILTRNISYNINFDHEIIAECYSCCNFELVEPLLKIVKIKDWNICVTIVIKRGNCKGFERMMVECRHDDLNEVYRRVEESKSKRMMDIMTKKLRWVRNLN
jgi:hypothetical protein